jgi:Bifunctional DNA primase/polymerase, N-terminal
MAARSVAGMANRLDPGDGVVPEPVPREHIAAFADVSLAALDLGAQGIPVFPCDPANKRPLVATGFKAATTDGPTITTWWKQWPQAMIGIPTGEPSGVFVLDIDRDEGKGLDGFAALASMEAAHGPLPETRTQRTPRGGEHRLFLWPGFKIKNSASKLGAGLDIRGDGGYIIVAPSVNADGVPYERINESDSVAAPHWLLVLLNGPTIHPTRRRHLQMSAGMSRGLPTGSAMRRSTARPTAWGNSSARTRSGAARSKRAGPVSGPVARGWSGATSLRST